MKAMQCELCGGTDIVKEGDFFVCQSCGMKYTPENARKMMVEVEGVVEVKGEVSIDNSKAVRTNLDMAQHALTSANFRSAEEYADKVLAMDQGNIEAWYVKARSVLGLTTVANDRVFESLVCCKKIIDVVKSRVRSDPPTVTTRDIELLHEVSDHVVSAVSAQYKLYADVFESTSSADIAEKIITNLPESLKTATLTLELLKASFQGEEARSAFRATDDEGSSDGDSTWKLLTDADKRIGELRSNCVAALANSALAAYKAEQQKFQQNNVFDYFGTGQHDDSLENSFLTSHWATLRLYVQLEDNLIELFRDRSVFRAMVGSEDDPVAKWMDYLSSFLSFKVMCLESMKTDRTYRRYHNQYSSGGVTNDGLFAAENNIKARDEEIAATNETKEAAEGEAREWLEWLRALQKEEAEAWWADNPELKARVEPALKSAREEIASTEAKLEELAERIEDATEVNKVAHPEADEAEGLRGEVAELEGQLKALGLFKMKERSALKAEISGRKERIARLEQQLKEELEAEEARVREATEPLVKQREELEEYLESLRSDVKTLEGALGRVPDPITLLVLMKQMLEERKKELEKRESGADA